MTTKEQAICPACAWAWPQRYYPSLQWSHFRIISGSHVNYRPNRKILQLRKWFNEINWKLQNTEANICYLCSKFIFINGLYLASLNDAWISGFTDADGCFSISISKKNNKNYVRARFILDQKCHSVEDIQSMKKIYNLLLLSVCIL